jgi:hypothetical protein
MTRSITLLEQRKYGKGNSWRVQLDLQRSYKACCGRPYFQPISSDTPLGTHDQIFSPESKIATESSILERLNTFSRCFFKEFQGRSACGVILCGTRIRNPFPGSMITWVGDFQCTTYAVSPREHCGHGIPQNLFDKTLITHCLWWFNSLEKRVIILSFDISLSLGDWAGWVKIKVTLGLIVLANLQERTE